MKMTNKVLAIAGALVASSAIAEDFPLEAQKQRCASEWSDDFSMQKFCLDEQSKAFGNLQAVIPSLNNDLLRSYTNCMADWRDDFSMRLFCIEEQQRAYDRGERAVLRPQRFSRLHLQYASLTGDLDETSVSGTKAIQPRLSDDDRAIRPHLRHDLFGVNGPALER